MVPICQWVFTCCICSSFDTAAVNFCAVYNFSFWQDKLVSIHSKFTNDLYFIPVLFYAPSFRLTSVILGKRISFYRARNLKLSDEITVQSTAYGLMIMRSRSTLMLSLYRYCVSSTWIPQQGTFV